MVGRKGITTLQKIINDTKLFIGNAQGGQRRRAKDH